TAPTARFERGPMRTGVRTGEIATAGSTEFSMEPQRASRVPQVTAGEQVAFPRPALPLEQGLLTGRVLDATGGVIVGARVVARTAAAPQREQVAESDELGRFQLQLSPGPVQLEAHADAYATNRQNAEAPARDVVLVLPPA